MLLLKYLQDQNGKNRTTIKPFTKQALQLILRILKTNKGKRVFVKVVKYSPNGAQEAPVLTFQHCVQRNNSHNNKRYKL